MTDLYWQWLKLISEFFIAINEIMLKVKLKLETDPAQHSDSVLSSSKGSDAGSPKNPMRGKYQKKRRTAHEEYSPSHGQQSLQIDSHQMSKNTGAAVSRTQNALTFLQSGMQNQTHAGHKDSLAIPSGQLIGQHHQSSV